MSVTLHNNPHAIRACVLYEVKQGKNVETAYRYFCATLGNDVMSFVDFDYWYYHFYNGNLDLDHDRSLDPKTHNFSELSNDLIMLLMDYSQLKERFHLRKVCRRFRDIFDNRPPGCTKISFDCSSQGAHVTISLHLDENLVGLYENTLKGCKITTRSSRQPMVMDNRIKKFIDGEHPVKIALNDMVMVLKNPNVQLEYLKIKFDGPIGQTKQYLIHMEDKLKPLTHKIQVKKLECHPVALFHLVPYLAVGTLESIELNGSTRKMNRKSLKKVFKMDQWKEAKELSISRPLFASKEQLGHFTRVILNLDSNNLKRMVPLKKILQKFPNLQTCHLFWIVDSLEIAEIWDALELPRRYDPTNPNIFCFSIPDCNGFYKIKYVKGNLLIGRNGQSPDHFFVKRIR